MSEPAPSLHPPKYTATLEAQGVRRWVYAERVSGRFARARNLAYGALILFFAVAPWISFGSRSLLRFDLPARRFHFFGLLFTPADFYLLALLLVLAMVGMFLFSAWLGRLWCGWACPQTVYLEMFFRRVDRLVEGKPSVRRALDHGPRGASYLSKKLLKHTIFAAISLLISLVFVSYFVSPNIALGFLLGTINGHSAAAVTLVVVAVLTYINFAYFREQLCTFLCPYARFQSVMLDDHSLIIGYDHRRGEPRGARKKDSADHLLGDCIDCLKCVRVCPTGIDIRDGLQLECVSCTACIDACDDVMLRMGKLRGLIRYDSQAGLRGQPKIFWRARTILYSMFFLAVLGGFALRLSLRESVSVTVARATGMPFSVQDDGKIRNNFRLLFTNTDVVEHAMTIDLSGAQNLELQLNYPLRLPPGARLTVDVAVLAPRKSVTSVETPFQFCLKDSSGVLLNEKAVFLAPAAEAR